MSRDGHEEHTIGLGHLVGPTDRPDGRTRGRGGPARSDGPTRTGRPWCPQVVAITSSTSRRAAFRAGSSAARTPARAATATMTASWPYGTTNSAVSTPDDLTAKTIDQPRNSPTA